MILIRDGLLIDPGARSERRGSLLIEGARIRAIGDIDDFDATGDISRVISVSGQWIFPGFIDIHVHLRDPGFEWKETIRSGSEAAVLGGFTAIACMPNTQPRNDHEEVTRFILSRARDAGLCRVLPIGAVSKGLLGKELAPLSELRDAGCVAFSDDGEPIYDAGLMRRALEWCRMLDGVISCHEEEKTLSLGGSMNESPLSYRLGLIGMPKVAEDVMVARDIELARATGGRVHICHVSTARGVELIRRAKNDGIRITAEVTPHHLDFNEEMVAGYDTNAKMSPPLREEEERQALRAGLRDGTIDCIASDHAPHEADAKMVEFARASYGILGLQTSLAVLLDMVRSGEMSRMRLAETMSHAPARCFGIEGGVLRVGAPADITVVDADVRWSFDREAIRSRSMNTPFLGREFQGKAKEVFVAGRQVVSSGELA